MTADTLREGLPELPMGWGEDLAELVGIIDRMNPECCNASFPKKWLLRTLSQFDVFATAVENNAALNRRAEGGGEITEEMVRRAEDARVESLRVIGSYGSTGVNERYDMAMRAALSAALGRK